MNTKPIAALLALLMVTSLIAGCLDEGANDEQKIDEGGIEPEPYVELEFDDNDNPTKVIPIVYYCTDNCLLEWWVDGVAQQNWESDFELSKLSAGQHEVKAVLTDANNETYSAKLMVTIAEKYSPPTVEISVPSEVYSGEEFSYSVVITTEGTISESCSIMIDDQKLTDCNGTLTLTDEGVFSFTVTTLGEKGEDVLHKEEITVVKNKAPELDVQVSPYTEGDLILPLGEDVKLIITTTDEENDDVTLTVDWGDGSSDVSSMIFDHEYLEAGSYTITARAADYLGATTWQMQVEVVEELDESQAFEMLDDYVDVDPAADLDKDKDGTMDEASAAEDEEGLDVDDTFSVDAQGNPDHDSGNIEAWDEKDEDDIKSVAESDDTSGAARDGEEDPLMSDEGRFNDSEVGDDEWEHLLEQEDIHVELFGEIEEEMSYLDDAEITDVDRYSNAIANHDAAWFNNTWLEDNDNDGADDTYCSRHAALLWKDANADGNPEKALIARYTVCVYDPDGDGLHEVTSIVAEGLNLSDMNSNGQPEVVEALRLSIMEWSNNSHADKDKHTEIAAFGMVDRDEDNNSELALAIKVNSREVDIGNDSILEAKVVYVGLLAIDDSNDDSTPENMVHLSMAEVEMDLDADGNINQKNSGISVINIEDVNADGVIDRYRAAQYGGEEWDNNSDGVVDSKNMIFLGVGIRDRNYDGVPDRYWNATGIESTTDADGDGIAEMSVEAMAATKIDDSNGDGNPEHVWMLTHGKSMEDQDDDGFYENRFTWTAAAEAVDRNSDGNLNRFTAMRSYEGFSDEHANGPGAKMTAIWVLDVRDWDSDGNANSILAIVGSESGFDNNSDGDMDTHGHQFQVWYGRDIDDDGHYERQVYTAYTKYVSDDEADGNVEYAIEQFVRHVKHSTASGMSHEWFVMTHSGKSNISTNNISQYQQDKIIAYETWNDTTREETHAYHADHTVVDSDRDGQAETDTWTIEDNRS